tara:strand:- start:379 stop:1572 length:1194 start_codon:yes stop_codon:yes gene_type:complete
MFDFFTFFIYLLVLGLLLILTNVKYSLRIKGFNFCETSKLRAAHFLGLLIISFVVGFRYEVGNDWMGYRDVFLSLKDNPDILLSDQYMEAGYFFVNKIISKLGMSYEWMFFTIAFISWYFIFKCIPNLLLPYLIFFLFVDEYFFWSMNGVRQFTSISIWLFAIRFIINNDLKRYLLFLGLSSLFHSSVLILIPFYFIPYPKINKRNTWLVLFFISLFIGSSSLLLNYFESFFGFLGNKIQFLEAYLRYVESNKLFVNEETKIGFGFIFKIIINLSIILISRRVINSYPKTTVYFILFFIGAILFNLSFNIQLLGRINHYFLVIRSVVLAIAVFHFWNKPNRRIAKIKSNVLDIKIVRFKKNTNERIAVIGFCLLYFILFLSTIYNSSNMSNPYQFSF